ncbi:hypothetical protein KJ761_02725, partial [Patescibacteria group bacterium]|nr:hypothetical protein [Patescibacteria group bacterium]
MLKSRKMMQERIKNILQIIQENQRYVWAVLVLLAVFFINYTFPADVITSENCTEGKCEKLVLEPQLSDTEKRFYENDAFVSQKNEFYRFIFQTETNQDTVIKLFTTNPLDQDKFIKEFELKKADGRKFQEAVFQTDQKYTDFLFEKKDSNGAEIYLKNIKISKLNVRSEKELASLQPTIFGEINFEEPTQKQEKNDFTFNQLLEPNVILGQVFQAESDFIGEIEMDISIIKQGNGNGDSYVLDLREADFDGVTPGITSRRVATLKFSSATIEEYRQANGKFKFPILAPVKNGEYYFIGLDNQKVEVNKFNYLVPRGSAENSSYANGNVAVKFKGDSFPAQGDLYFKIFGTNFKEVAGKKVLLGATIEDLGNKQMLYKYQPDESRYIFSDFAETTDDIDFDRDDFSMFGNTD